MLVYFVVRQFFFHTIYEKKERKKIKYTSRIMFTISTGGSKSDPSSLSNTKMMSNKWGKRLFSCSIIRLMDKQPKIFYDCGRTFSLQFSVFGVDNCRK